jgi:Zn-dependent peptidase ImmA (M78 family)
VAQLRRREIERLAEDLRKRHGFTSAPVPVEKIAELEAIEVIRVSAGWNESGFLLRERDSRPVIGINRKNSPKRQRFTLAHELGHWQLHRGKPLIVDHSVMINKRDDVSSQATEPEEIQANQFAAALLMPESLVRNSAVSGGFRSRDDLIARLATEFDVSTDSMTWRLVNLGILST